MTEETKSDTKLKMMSMAQRILAPYIHSEAKEDAPSKYYMEVSDMDNKLKSVYVSASVYKDLTNKIQMGSVFEFPWRMQERNFVFYGPGENPKVATKVRLVSKKGRDEVARYIKAHGGTIAEANSATSQDLHAQAEAEAENMSSDTIADLSEARVLVVTKDPRTQEVAIRKDGMELTQAQSTDVIKQLTDAADISPGMELRNMVVDKVMHTRSELVVTLSRK